MGLCVFILLGFIYKYVPAWGVGAGTDSNTTEV